MVLGGRPYYRFDSRTIKRDYRTSRLVTLYVECSNLCIFCIILSCLSWVVLYVRTLGLSIALKRAQDHRNLSSYEKVTHIFISCDLLSLGIPGTRGLGPPGTRGMQYTP